MTIHTLRLTTDRRDERQSHSEQIRFLEVKLYAAEETIAKQDRTITTLRNLLRKSQYAHVHPLRRIWRRITGHG